MEYPGFIIFKKESLTNVQFMTITTCIIKHIDFDMSIQCSHRLKHIKMYSYMLYGSVDKNAIIGIEYE